MPVSAEALFAWHARPGAFERLVPPWEPVSLVQFEGIEDGKQAVIHIGNRLFKLQWVAEHRDFQQGRQFRDVQVAGPFRSWVHTHRTNQDLRNPDASFLLDHIVYSLPFGGLAQAVAGRAIRQRIERQFAYRHRITRQDTATHGQYYTRPLRIAITGASGLLGSNLTAFLTTGGHTVYPLVRRAPNTPQEIQWNPKKGTIEAEKLEGLDAVIHLAGENVFALRWTKAKKRRILESRSEGTRLLSETLAALHNPPPVLISASGIGYYGDQGDTLLTEEAPPATDRFLAEVCQAWEAALAPAAAAGIRTVAARIGVVLSPSGGALAQMLPAFKLGLGGRLGRKSQYLSWITMDDVLRAFYHLLHTDALAGPVNVTAPVPVTMEAFAETLATVLRRPSFLHVPAGALRLAMGEVASETILASTRVQPQRLLDTGFSFCYEHLEGGLRHLLGRTFEDD